MNTEKDHLEPETQEKPLTATVEVDSVDESTGEDSVDYTHYSKEELVKLTEDLRKESDLRKVDSVLRQVKPAFDEVREKERSEALGKFIADGGDENDFDFKLDEISQRFDTVFRELKEKRVKQIQENEKAKEKNLQTKLQLLDRLRQLTDVEETTVSISELKDIQQQWKSIGPVPASQNKSLWASYNALIELFYSNRSIYFELKELDRKKNFALKLELCEKAEKLAGSGSSSAAIKELHELHEEYKHIGPVPKEDQEALWQRFKAASDAVYVKRRDQLEGVKKELDDNFHKKLQLCERVDQFTAFDSDKITDWNDKTKEILELQKQWEAIGVVPRERAKEVNKRFWSGFKSFFHRKNDFFRKIEHFREENLRRKLELCAQVEALKESDDLEHTAEQIKQLQQAWKEIGPVPEKQRNAVYERFKVACDEFFNRRREQRSSVDREFEANFQKKSDICARIEQLSEAHSNDMAAFEQLRAEWQNTGFVPRKNMHAIQKRYLDAVQKFLNQNPALSNAEKDTIQVSVEVNTLRSSPKSSKLLQKKEIHMRKRLTQLENDISLWKNNMEFFAHSKKADLLKQEFEKKIQAAEDEYKTVKRQLQLMHENQ